MELRYLNGNPAFPFEGKEGAVCSVWEMKLAKGETVAPHAHPAGIEIYIVVDGIGEITVAGNSNTILSGDVVHIPPNSPHSASNTMDQTLHVIGVLWDHTAANAQHAASQDAPAHGRMDASAALAHIARLTAFAESIKERMQDPSDPHADTSDERIADFERTIVQSIGRIWQEYQGRI